jgi:NADPH:quinone reductase
MPKRIIVTHYGGLDALQLIEEKCPEPKRDEVRVRVLAAGVALPDVLAREGIHPGGRGWSLTVSRHSSG